MPTSRQIRSSITLIVATMLLIVIALNVELPRVGGLSTQSSSPTAAPAPFDQEQAGKQLSSITVSRETSMAGYDREARFGRWADLDGDGCNSRAEILGRDGNDVRYNSNCTVSAGSWVDPYTDKAISARSIRQASSRVQVDHIVPLAEAWRSGSSQWNDDKRLAFANDPLNLIASDASQNMSKGDKDAARWLPPSASYRSAYAAQVIAVKAKWGLSVDRAERDALAQLIA